MGRSTPRIPSRASLTSPGSRSRARPRPPTPRACSLSAIDDPNPVLYFEHKHLYRRIKGEVPDERFTVPFGKARVHHEGADVTVVTWGAMVHTAAEAAERLEDEDALVGGDSRPAHDHPVGPRGRPRSVERTSTRARAARGHAHGRLRRRDRGHDRRGGLRAPRRAGDADSRHRTRLYRSRLRSRSASSRRWRTSSARCEVSHRTDESPQDHPQQERPPAVSRRQHGHRDRCRRRDAPDGRLRLRRARSRSG